MTFDFTGQAALVTGGNKGIGRAIVEMLSAGGAAVVSTGTDEKALAEVGRLPGVRALRLVLAKVDEAETIIDGLEAKFDVLVNNAGINIHGLTGELDMADFDRVMLVNVRGAALLCRALVPAMARRGYGRVVNVTSIFSLVSKARRASYTTSKFALAGFTRTLALDYAGTGVLANSVAPGFIATEMTERMLGESGIREMTAQVPLGRLGTASEVAQLVGFLASRLNTFVTGQNIAIDGGFTST